MTTRYAIVRGTRSRSEAEAYLPGNYRVIWYGDAPVYTGGERVAPAAIIAGTDDHGWTLDGYVIPRYASGLIGCEEFDQDDPPLVRFQFPADDLPTDEEVVSGMSRAVASAFLPEAK